MAAALAGSALAASSAETAEFLALMTASSGFALVFHVAFNGFDKVWYQVVTTSQLHIDLGERVANTVTLIDKTVVNTDRPKHDHRDNNQEYQE